MTKANHYDYIICGAGAAGLSLAYKMRGAAFKNKKILILDRETKNKNDRTWSFWIDRKHEFEDIVHKRWTHINFYGNQDLEDLPINPYQYQMIRGIDFYQYVLAALAERDNIDIVYEEILTISADEETAFVQTSQEKYTCTQAFNSIVKSFPTDEKLFVWQHFKGWIIETPENKFDPNTATFMDFRVEQEGETRFVYVLPFDKTSALVEATIFSKEIADEALYDDMLQDYCARFLELDDYKIKESEKGAIPMTTGKFDNSKPNRRVIPIGTLNGTVKASSGYAFQRIQNETDYLVNQLRNKEIAKRYTSDLKYMAYDKTLLNVIITKKETGKSVFSMMFARNKAPQILKFLDEKTSLLEEINIFRTLPFLSFLGGFAKENLMLFNKTKTS